MIFIVALLPLMCFSQQILSGGFKPSKDLSYVFLYKKNPNKSEFIQSKQLDSLGRFSMALDSTVTAGIYQVIYGLPVQKNNFEIIYNGKENIDFTFYRDSIITYNESNENKLWRSYLKSIDLVNQTISKYYLNEDENKSGFEVIFKTLEQTQKAYEASAQGMLVKKFILANKPYVPKQYEDVGTYSKNLKANYLKHIDYNDSILQSSSFLIKRVKNYVFDMIEKPSNETYIQLIDEVVTSINDADAQIKEILLSVIWKTFVDKKNDALVNYIGKKYLLDIVRATQNKQLETFLIGELNTAVGNKAPNFEINLSEEINSLYDLSSHDNYLLIFWSSTCGHCLNELPKIHEKIKNKTNLKVIAFGIESDTVSWIKEKEKLKLFTHTIGLGKWQNDVVETYGIKGTPSYFILDKNLNIASKPHSLTDLLKALETIE